MGIFSLLATPLGYIMRLIHMVVGNYGWVIVIFTFLVRIVMIPLTMKQQKSTARTTAYQPMIQEIQKKWANDKQRQQQEMQKFYEENNIKMTAGCAPMAVNMLVLFGIIAVIQAPLTYILQIPADQVQNGVAIVQYYDPESKISTDTYTQQSLLIGQIKQDPERFVTGVEVTDDEGNTELKQMDAADVDKVLDFDFQFLGLDLSQAPTMDFNRNLIMPILSILTMFASQIIIMRTSGQQQSGKMMWIMTIVMGVMFGFFAFRVPLGFSLYYTVSNVVMTLQQLVVRKIYDPEKIRAQVIAELEEKRLAKKSKKKVVVKEEDGTVVSLDLSEADIARMRLQKARELDAERFGLNEGMSESELAAAEKARALDAERYGGQAEAPAGKMKTIEAPASAGPAGPEGDRNEPEAPKPAAKPGRRKRARSNKESTEHRQEAAPAEDETSFADAEKQAEEKNGGADEPKEGQNA